MTNLLIQHGPAKGQKIDKAFEKNIVEGTVFAPREETMESIKQYCNNSVYLNKDNTFIDPQFYYSTFNIELLKLLKEQFEYPTKVTRKDWRKRNDRLFKYFDNYSSKVEEVSNNIITPGFCIDSIDWKFDYSIDFYNYFKEKYKFEHYYMSLMIASEIFHSKNDVEDILEDIKDNVDEKDGIYLIIKYPSTQIKNYESMDPETLSNILYFVYSLKMSGFKVIIGYTFLNSILFSMIDCDAISTGWFNNLRKFEQSKFESVDSFGIRKKRYVSVPTLTNMTLELINECKEMDIAKLYSNTRWDSMAIEDQDNVSFVDLEQQYWEALHNIIAKINQKGTILDKVRYMRQCIEKSRSIYDEILNITEDKREVQNRIRLEFKHIDDWQFAIELFEKKVALL